MRIEDFIASARVYDNGGKTADRYTVVFMSLPYKDARGVPGLFEALGLSPDPDHPQGVSLWGPAKPGKHLGQRIPFSSLPPLVQRHVQERLADTE